MLRPARWAAALTLLVSAACAAPSEGRIGEGFCEQALLEGTLVRDEEAGLAVMGEGGEVAPVEWPAGWTVRDVFGERHLFDETGRDIGSEGDHLSVGGGSGPDEVFRPCGPYRIVPSP